MRLTQAELAPSEAKSRLPIPCCLVCGSDLAPADATHRFCPYCGHQRVLADPPDTSRDDGLFVIGYDVVGPRSGLLYAYARSKHAVERIDPLRGPFGTDGCCAPDLYASAGNPLPTNAWYLFGSPGPAPVQAGQPDKEMGAPLAHLAIRHTRMFIVADNGRLSALDSRTLAPVSGWQGEEWPHAIKGSRLQVSESLVYVAGTRGGAVFLTALEIGQGHPVIRQPLNHRNPQVVIAGGDILVMGEGKPDGQIVESFALSDYASARMAQPRRRSMLHIQGAVAPASPHPVRLGDEFILSAADGRIYRWPAGTEDDDPPEELWSNLAALQLRPECLVLAKDEVGFVGVDTTSARRVRLIRIQRAGGRAREAGVVDLEPLDGSNSLAVAAHEGTVYMASHQPGEAIRIHALKVQTGEQSVPYPFPGTADAEMRELQVVPWRGRFRLLVHYVVDTKHEFWFVDLETGDMDQVGGSPLRSNDVRVVWDAGRVWMADLTERDRIKLIPY